MNRLLVLAAACIVAVAAAAGSALALGVSNGLDGFDAALALVRTNDSDAAHQAAVDAVRAKLADPKIDTLEKQVKAFSAGLASVQKSYGTLDAFAMAGGFQVSQLEAAIALPVFTSGSACNGVLLEYLSTPLTIVKLSKQLLAITNGYTKGTDPVKVPDIYKRLKNQAKYAKKFAAFYKKYHKK